MLWAQHDGKEHSSFMTEERAIVIGLGMTESIGLNMTELQNKRKRLTLPFFAFDSSNY
jgi:hypothetical protein